MKYGHDNDSAICWCILSEEEQNTECPMEREWVNMNEVEAICQEIPWDADPAKVDYNCVSLDHFITSLKGKAKVLDDFLCLQPKNPQGGNPWKVCVQMDNICSHCEDSDDPDELSNVFCITFN